MSTRKECDQDETVLWCKWKVVRRVKESYQIVNKWDIISSLFRDQRKASWSNGQRMPVEPNVQAIRPVTEPIRAQTYRSASKMAAGKWEAQ